MLSRFRLALVVRHLRHGGIVAYPTEGVYGLGCDPLNPAAVQSLTNLKGRPAAKGFILIAASFSQIEPFLKIENDEIRKRLVSSWPGPVTWVVPAADWVPRWLRGTQVGLAARTTAHPVAAAMCSHFGAPLISTSANMARRRPARTGLAVRKCFREKRLMVVPGSISGLRGPTPIFDVRSGARLR